MHSNASYRPLAGSPRLDFNTVLSLACKQHLGKASLKYFVLRIVNITLLSKVLYYGVYISINVCQEKLAINTEVFLFYISSLLLCGGCARS